MNIIQLIQGNRKLLLRWVGTLTALVLLIILFRNQGWSEIRSTITQVSFGRLSFCFLLIFISRFAVVGRWHSLIAAVAEVPLGQSIRLTFAGLFATNFLPTTVGGDIVRLAGAKQLKIDFVMSAASLIVDRLIGMVGMVFALPFGAPALVTWMSSTRFPQIVVYWAGVFTWVSNLMEQLIRFLGRIYRAFSVWSEHPKSLLLSFGFTIVHMLCFFGTITLLFDGMGENLSLGLVGGLWSFVYFVTLFPISINGYGVQEISMALIFSEVGGISLHNSLAVSILFRTLLVLGSIPGAFLLPGIISGTKNMEDAKT